MFQFKRKVLIGLIVVIKNEFIDPVQAEQSYQKEYRHIRNIETVKTVECPHIKSNHQFERQREGHRSQLFMQSPLTKLISLSLLIQEFVLLSVESEITQIHYAQNDIEQAEQDVSYQESSQLKVVRNAWSHQIENCR